MGNGKLTSKAYWENYYKISHAKKDHIIQVCSYYNNFWDVLFDENSKDKSFIEIGGFPGRYLAYVSSEYGVKPICLDYNTDSSQIEASFKVMNINNYEIIQEDFLRYKPKKLYDFVFSNGFIEHFEDYKEIMDLHLAYLKPGGKLIMMIPNKRYFRKIYGYLCDYKNLKAHNLQCMNLSVFKKFAQRNHLKIRLLQYYGGFPFSVHQELNLLQKVVYKLVRGFSKKIINPILMKHPSKYLSASIIAIFEKK